MAGRDGTRFCANLYGIRSEALGFLRVFGSFSKAKLTRRVGQAGVRKVFFFAMEAHHAHALSRVEGMGSRMPVLLCGKRLCYSSSGEMGLARISTESQQIL